MHSLPQAETIRAESLLGILESGQPMSLVDVRTPSEFEREHLLGSHLIPLEVLKPENVRALSKILPDQRIYLLCQTGHRAALAAQKFADGGFFDTVIVEGGILACEKAGWIVERRGPKFAMERQVRIAAGSIVVLGALLGFLVHPAAFVLSVLAGFGLIFAGITNTCGMAKVLSWLPWNRQKPKSD